MARSQGLNLAGCMPSYPTAGPSPAQGTPTMKEGEPKDQQLTVALRIRPLNDTELEEGATVIAHRVGGQTVVLMDPCEDPEDTLRTHRSREKTFTFDTVLDQRASQEDVYRATTQQLVEGVISGYNATVFAYGPSGTGKTHTMLGTDAEPGIYLQTLTDLFRAIEDTRDNMDYRVSMSYLEIYNEVIRDLLNPSSGLLELREDARGSTQIAGMTEVSTSNAQEIMQLLTRGNRQRTQEPTAANRTSSRSHAVLQVTVLQQGRGADRAEGVRVGRLFMVDLAGSERASQTQNRGKRMQEGAHINRSLLALGNCINALSEKGGSRTHYVNFRDSKLTRLLKDALGGNSRTVMVAHISPASTSFEESRTTLLYADRAKNIKTRVRRNLLHVSCHMDQCTDVIADLRGQIEHLKSGIERQDRKGSEPGGREAPGTTPARATQEGGRLQTNRLGARLVGAFREQLAAGRSLVELENASTELHASVARLLLAIARWEQESHHRGQDWTPKRQAVADADGDEGESAEPHEVALAREEVHMLLAEQRKTVALKAGLAPCLASSKRKASQPEKLLPTQAVGEDQREVLRRPCRAHGLEPGNAGLQASRLRRDGLPCPQDLVPRRCHQHRLLCERIIREQQQLMQDGGIRVPRELGEHCRLFSRAPGEGSLDHLLPLRSATASSLRDGSAVNTPLGPEESSRDQPDDRKDLRWGAQLDLPPVLLETDRDSYKSSKATPSKRLGRQEALVPPSPLRDLLTPPAQKLGSLGVKNLVSTLRSPASLELGAPRTAAGDLKDMASGTRGIALIAAARRSRGQDPEGGSGRSSLHLPEEVALSSRDPSPADSRWPHAGPGRDLSVERKARRKRSPRLPCVQLTTEKPRPCSQKPLDESPTPPAPHQLSKSSGRGLFPAIPAASRVKPSLRPHAGSTDSGGRRHSPLPPSNPHKHQGGSAKGPRRPK